MNTNREKKVVEVKQTKTTVKFKDNTLISWVLYKKDTEIELDENTLNLVKNFIY